MRWITGDSKKDSLMTKYTDKQLVEGCKKNNRHHQELLYRKYFPAMMRMCMRYTKEEDDAIMIVNDGFLRVFQKIEQFAYKGSLEGWIRRVVFNSISAYFRKNSKYLQFFVFEEKAMMISPKEVVTTVLDDMFYDELVAKVKRLPGMQKAVFEMFAIEGYSHIEIAQALKIPVGTSKWLLSEARKELKSMLGKARKNTNYG